ncbi:MAG: lysophospholipid acyltransferase family protein [Ghiorsea sp.]
MRFKDKLIVVLVTTIIWLLKRTIRWKYIGSDVRPENTPCIVSCWHSRLLLTPFLLGKWSGPVIISDHHDGVLIAAVYENFGMKSSRGSSSKGGARALLKVIRQAKDGASPGITPDGPRGPAQVVKEGVAQIAIKSGLPVLPVCYATSRRWRLASWDKFYVPKPFTKGIIMVGEPLFAESDESTTDFTSRIQQAMNLNQKSADSYYL